MDWPISWQKVKDSSDNAGGGSGSGLPVIDLREYNLVGGGANKLEGDVFGATDVRAMEDLNRMPFIAQFIYDSATPNDDGEWIIDKYTVVMNYINASIYPNSDSPFNGYVGNAGNMVFKIMSARGPGSDFFDGFGKRISVTLLT